MQLSPQKTQLLIDQITNLPALEEKIGSELSLVSDRVMEHTGTTDALRRFGTVIEAHAVALKSRLEKIGGDQANIPRSPSLPQQDLASGKSRESQPASSSLQSMYSLFSGAILGYAILHVISHRFYESTGDGNTADMAEKHLRDYAELSQSINNILSDAVVWDLGRIGQECQCQCPSCSLGICLCSPHGTNTVDEIWRKIMQTSGQPLGPGNSSPSTEN